MRIVGKGTKTTKLIEYIESSSEPGIFYKVVVCSDNSITCECPAIKTCKHIKKVIEKYKIQ